jgi:enoyl-[acyl-carrier-protein] reductase (NADH)
MRVLALEGGALFLPGSIPDARALENRVRIDGVDTDSMRAAAYNIDTSELQAHYRSRSLLKRDVLPEDVATAVLFFATEDSAKSTGNVLNVDAGHAGAFTR